MNFRGGKKKELSINVYFEGQNKASMADWFQSRESHLNSEVNRDVGSQPSIQRRERAGKGK